MSDRLVDDILDLIFAGLHPGEWTLSWPRRMPADDLRRDLAMCSLVSKRWRVVARPHLFRDIVYTFRAVPEEGTTAVEGEPYMSGARYRTLRMLHTFLQQNNFARTAIRRLQLWALPTTANGGTVMSMFSGKPDFIYGPRDMIQAQHFMGILALTANLTELHLRDIILAVPRPVFLPGVSLQNLHIGFGLAQALQDWNVQPDYATTKILSCFDFIGALNIDGLTMDFRAAMPPVSHAPDLSHLKVHSLHLGYLMGTSQRGLVPQSLQKPLFAQSLRILDFLTTADDQLPAQHQLLGFVQGHIEELMLTVDSYVGRSDADDLIIIPRCPNLWFIRLRISLIPVSVGEGSESRYSVNRLVLCLRQCQQAVSLHPKLSSIVLNLAILVGRDRELETTHAWLSGLASELGDLDSALVEYFDLRPSCTLTIEYDPPTLGSKWINYATTLVRALARYLPKMVECHGLTFCVAGQYLREYEH